MIIQSSEKRFFSSPFVAATWERELRELLCLFFFGRCHRPFLVVGKFLLHRKEGDDSEMRVGGLVHMDDAVVVKEVCCGDDSRHGE